MIHRPLALVATTVLVAATIIAAAPAATASNASNASGDGQTLVSLDGLTFSQAPEGSLFDPATRVVPGDALTGTLWVQNDSTGYARLTLAVTDQSGSTDLLKALRIVHTPNEWLPVAASTGQCDEMTIGEQLDPGAVTRVDLTLLIDDALAGRTAQNSAGAFAVRAVLSDPVAPVPDACASSTVVSGTPGAAPRSSSIASTGVVVAAPLAAAAGAILLGVLLGARRRRAEPVR